MNTAAEAKGLDKKRIRVNGPNWWGNGGFDGLDASKRKFSRDGEAWRYPDGASDGVMVTM